MTDKLKDRSQKCCAWLAQNPDRLESILKLLDVAILKHKPDLGYFRIKCPVCSEAGCVRYKGTDAAFWLCFDDEKQCHRKLHSSVLGLIRHMRGGEHPDKTMDWIRDMAKTETKKKRF